MLRLSAYFPPVPIRCSCEKELRGLGIDPARYVGMCLILSSLASAALLPVLLALGLPLLVPLGFILPSCLFLILPRLEMRKRASEIEARLPFFLRSLGMLLEMGMPFQRAMRIASEGEGALAEEMGKVSAEAGHGSGIRGALSSFAMAFPSLGIKRAVSQMLSAFESGGSGERMRRIGDDLLSMERHRLKEHASKSAMFGLLFIISSAVLPTLFLVYAGAGSLLMGQEVGPTELMLAMLILFPAISAMLLALSKSMMPHSGLSGGSGFDFVLLAPGVLFALGFTLGLQLPFMISGAAICVYRIASTHREEKRIEQLEASLPDALFAVGGLPRSAKPEDIFRAMEGMGGALAQEARKSSSQLSMDVSADAVLDDMRRRNGSALLHRACHMIRQMLGTDSLDKLGLLAEDIIRAFQVQRERSQLLSMQKYTLIFGSFLIAMILKTSLRLLRDMGDLAGSAPAALGQADSIIPAYLVIYSALASAAIADAEGRGSSMATHFLLLCLLGLGTYFIQI